MRVILKIHLKIQFENIPAHTCATATFQRVFHPTAWSFPQGWLPKNHSATVILTATRSAIVMWSFEEVNVTNHDLKAMILKFGRCQVT